MASLYIAEYKDPSVHTGKQRLTAKSPTAAEQKLTIGAGSVPSLAFGPDTFLIRVVSDTTCSYQVAADPTATAALSRLPANAIEYIEVQPGDKIAVIENT